MTNAFPRRATLALPALLLATRHARAQSEWKPSHSVRLVVPTTAGGTTDVMARLLAQYLQPIWGQPVVVDNRAGAGGVIGTLEAVRAAPDGHTFLMGNVGAQSIVYSLVPNLPYTPGDLVPVHGMISGPNALVVHPSLPVRNVVEFVQYLRANPDKLSYGTPGVGQTPHLVGVWFNQILGTRSTPVHYRGSGPAAADLFGGTIQYMFDALVNASEPARTGRIRLLATSGEERYPTLPDVPTVHESMPELAAFTTASWVGLFAPKNTPPAAIRSITTHTMALLAEPGSRQRFLDLGGVPLTLPPEEYAAFVQAETAKWTQVIQREGLKIDLA
ncbi:MAG: C4-dicarboxylate transporter [Roseomonas sp.]|nr:C4-dicarboxylate transporter [Roseomonas sp.]